MWWRLFFRERVVRGSSERQGSQIVEARAWLLRPSRAALPSPPALYPRGILKANSRVGRRQKKQDFCLRVRRDEQCLCALLLYLSQQDLFSRFETPRRKRQKGRRSPPRGNTSMSGFCRLGVGGFKPSFDGLTRHNQNLPCIKKSKEKITVCENRLFLSPKSMG